VTSDLEGRMAEHDQVFYRFTKRYGIAVVYYEFHQDMADDLA
jgi:predicted GIY-YIG superfamily endonuclease